MREPPFTWVEEVRPKSTFEEACDRADAERARRALPQAPPWPEMAPEAYYGLAGDIVRTIEPQSEADPVALLIQLLTMAGNAIGRLPYYQVESDRHRTNLFCAMVGVSSKGRKGTAAGRVRAVVRTADEAWDDERLKGGLSSGEGLISEVRDPTQKWN